MELLPIALSFAFGALLGVLVTLFASRQNEQRRSAHENSMQEALKNTFSTLATEALDSSNERFLTLAQTRLETQTTRHSGELEGKKVLIDQRLEEMTGKLSEVSAMVREFETARDGKLGALKEELDKLNSVSTNLHDLLSNNRSRGKWGERMAEDILRIFGFIEGTNYARQSSLETDGSVTRPDFTFFLPNNLLLHMDVKFPLDNFELFYGAPEGSPDKETYKKKFLGDVKNRIKEINKRGYINDNTVDCVLIFIPNEQIYRFIHEEDSSIIDEALKNRVVICSPITLFVVLAVIRQAVKNFKLEKSSQAIVTVLSEFEKQWNGFAESMDKIGKALSSAQSAYDDMFDKRRKKLDTQLEEVRRLREADEPDRSDEPMAEIEDSVIVG